MNNVTCLDTFRAARLAPVAVEETPVRGTFGRKYDRDLNIVEIAKRVREDIKAAGFPKGLKCSVRISKFSMGQSLHVNVTAIPEGFAIVSLASVRAEMEGRELPGRDSSRTPAAKQIVATLEGIVAAYNRDDSDSQVDHFDTNFYSHIGVDWRLVSAQHDEMKAMLTTAYSVAPGAPSAVA